MTESGENRLWRRIDRMPDKLRLSKDILGLWEQTVCEIRSEIKSWDLIGANI